jgi:hypothetical protein
MAGTPASKQAASSSSSSAGAVADGMRLTPKAWLVRCRTAAISRAISAGDSRTMPSNPNPPAAETAAANSARAGPPMPAEMIG